jgi:hypothetical protein
VDQPDGEKYVEASCQGCMVRHVYNCTLFYQNDKNSYKPVNLLTTFSEAM